MPDLLVGSFAPLLLAFESCFTQPSFRSFWALSCAWILCSGRRSLTRIIQAAQLGRYEHFCSFHRFFSQARWNLDDLGHCVFQLLLPSAPRSWSEPSMTPWPASPDATSGAPACITIPCAPPRRAPSSPSATTGWSSPCTSAFPSRPIRPGLSPSSSASTANAISPGWPRSRRQTRKETDGAATEKQYRTRPQLAREMIQIVAGSASPRSLLVLGDRRQQN